MNIKIVSIGKIKESFYTAAINEYAKRLSRFVKFSIIELEESICPKKPTDKEIVKALAKESVGIIDNIEGYSVLLDRVGKQINSVGFAELINKTTLTNSTITFIIGSSYGVASDVLKKVDLSVSFGEITFPHQLMRVVLAEQIYRACMINANCSYHK